MGSSRGKVADCVGVKGGKSASDDIAGGLACWLCVVLGGKRLTPDILCLCCSDEWRLCTTPFWAHLWGLRKLEHGPQK